MKMNGAGIRALSEARRRSTVTDKQPQQAMGKKDDAEKPDGVNDVKWDSKGESYGGAYTSPMNERTNKQSGFMGHGGQTHINHSGPDGSDANAPTEDEPD